MICGIVWSLDTKQGQIWLSPSFIRGIMLSPNLSTSYKLSRSGMHSAPSYHTKLVVFLTNNLSPSIGGAPSLKLYFKNGTVEHCLNDVDGLPMVKLPKISCLFDKNLSPGVGGTPSRNPYLKNYEVEFFFNGGDAVLMVKLAISSHLFDNNLSPGVGGVPSRNPYFKNYEVEIFLMAGMRSSGSN